jgi:hypothetical protein
MTEVSSVYHIIYRHWRIQMTADTRSAVVINCTSYYLGRWHMSLAYTSGKSSDYYQLVLTGCKYRSYIELRY